MTEKAPVITIDGPSGAGKGTISQLLAKKMGWQLLDSGAIYRVLALAAIHHDVKLEDEPAIALLAAHLDVQFLANSEQSGVSVILEGEDVTHAIRSQETSDAASRIAVFPTVREALLRRQRAFCVQPGLIADGRDMGTVVFPNAPLKLFLTASAEQRAQRRYNQLIEQGFSVNIERLLTEIKERDHRDTHRAVAPLVPAGDALVIDTTEISIDEVLEKVLEQVVKKHF